MILLRLISWPYVRKHALRSLLTVAGIVLGVAVFVGMHTANQSVLFAFRQTIDRIAGATQLQVSAGETGFEESVLERVQSVPGVRVAVPVVEATVNTGHVNTGLKEQGNLLVLGVDMTGDQSLRRYDLENADQDAIDDPLVFLAQADSLIVTDAFGRENGLHINSKLRLDTMEGPKTFTVRGIMKSGGLASAFGGNLAVMDIYAAQKMFGRGRTFDRIDVAVNEGVRVEDVQRQLQALLGAGFQVEAPSARGAQFESMARVYSLTANITSAFALFIGMFIIYNTFSIAVAQRRPEIGILRALGATQGQIRMLFVGESVVAGLAGSAAGVLFGVVLARGMTSYIGGLLGEMYGVAQKAEEVSANPKLIGFALALGVLTSVLAALIPARNAARVDPVQALQKGRYQQLSAGESRARRIAALIACAIALACLFQTTNRVLFYVGDVMAMLSLLLLVPAFGVTLARALRPVLKAVRPVEGTLAADSLIQAPRRTSGTVAALMLSIALVVSLGGLARASYDSINRWMRVALNPDLFLAPSQSLTSRSFRFPASMADRLRTIRGISEVQAVRNGRVSIRGRPIMLIAADVNAIRQRVKLPPLAGDAEEMYRLAAAGKGVLASENFTLLHGFRYGDTVDIPSPSGVLTLPIVGVVTDYSDQQGSLLMDRNLFIRNWRDDSINVFRIYLTNPADEAAVKGRILEAFGNHSKVFVLTNRELKDYVLRLTDQWFGITYVQIAVAVLVAILGIVNALTVSITDRRRELGVLQAVGGLRFQIRRTIWLEALSIGTIGLVLGLLAGAVQLWYGLDTSRRDLAGLTLDYEYPVQIVLMLIPVILGAALISAIGPAESAVRAPLVEALEYE